MSVKDFQIAKHAAFKKLVEAHKGEYEALLHELYYSKKAAHYVPPVQDQAVPTVVAPATTTAQG